jgi:hypothetical protein
MSKIKNLMSKTTDAWIEFPDIEGFEVNLHYLQRDELTKIRNQSLTYKFNKRTRQREEEVDNDKFIELYSEKAVIDWKGLKVKHLTQLFPANIQGMDPEEEVEFTVEDAIELLKNSSLFDQFVTDAMNDFEKFSKTKADIDTKN